MPPDQDSPFDFGTALNEVAASGEIEFPETGLDREEGDPPAPSPAPEASPSPAPTPTPTPSSAPTPTPSTIEYPKTWKPDFKAAWDTLDPSIRAEVARREEDFHRGLTPYRVMAENLKTALTPLSDLLRAGSNPYELIQNFGTYHQALSSPEHRVAALKALAEDYGISLEDLTKEAPYVHPQVQRLQSEIGEVRSHLSAQNARAAQEAQRALRGQIEVFAADPKNEHFQAVAGEMAKLIRADTKLTLDDAYQQAIWLVPAVREKELEKQAKARADAAAAAAKAAEGSARSNARSAPATGAVGSMDDTMRQVLRELKARDS